MVDNFNIIQDLLRNKAELQSRLNLIPYEGTIEIKEVDNKKYLYIRKRIANKVKSTYVGIYSIELHSMLLKQVKDAKEKNIIIFRGSRISLRVRGKLSFRLFPGIWFLVSIQKGLISASNDEWKNGWMNGKGLQEDISASVWVSQGFEVLGGRTSLYRISLLCGH